MDLDRNDIPAAIAWARQHAPIRPETWSSLIRLQDKPEAIVKALRALDEELGGKLIRAPELRAPAPIPQIAPAPSVIEPDARAWLEAQKGGLWLQSETTWDRKMPVCDWHIDRDGFHFVEAGDYDGRNHVWELLGVRMAGRMLQLGTTRETWEVQPLADITRWHEPMRELVDRWRGDQKGRPFFGSRQGRVLA